MTGEPKFRKKLSRRSFPKFMAEQPPAMVVMEACGSAHYWARELTKLGHEVKLIAPRYVNPFVKRQKHDVEDAEAIVVAAQRPEILFVDPKSSEQHSRAILFRARERLVHQRTELVNALRACLYEYGHVVAQGIQQITRIAEILNAPNNDLHDLMSVECRDRLALIAEPTVSNTARNSQNEALRGEQNKHRGLKT